ncbi:hypothetical protein ACLQ2Q_05330 [Microbacterium sp. DT81.1]|uniref:hypothetical protein n=1 Tax=Microbacterium sp. DT81.1 TaxID=3393413 RepID=UPI003CF059C6
MLERLPEPQSVLADRRRQGAERQLDVVADATCADDFPPRLDAYDPAGERPDEPREGREQNDQKDKGQ